LLLRTALLFVRSAVRLVYAERNRAGRHAHREGDVEPNETQIEVNTAPRKPESWRGYSNNKVTEFGVYAAHNYSEVDRDGITSFAAPEDLERVVKVIDIAHLDERAASSPSRTTPERNRRPRSGNEKRPSRRI
jgi:hypothetical protein